MMANRRRVRGVLSLAMLVASSCMRAAAKFLHSS